MANSDSFSSKYGDLGPFSPPKKKRLKKSQGKNSSQKETLVSRTIRNKSGWWTRVFFCGEFSSPGDKKKKGWRIQQRDFSELKKKSPYLEKKKVGSRQI
jgi:hypothetical protein